MIQQVADCVSLQKALVERAGRQKPDILLCFLKNLQQKRISGVNYLFTMAHYCLLMGYFVTHSEVWEESSKNNVNCLLYNNMLSLFNRVQITRINLTLKRMGNLFGKTTVKGYSPLFLQHHIAPPKLMHLTLFQQLFLDLFSL